MRRKAKLTDVFLKINMQGDGEHFWTNPETNETTPCWHYLGKLNSEGRAYIQIDGEKWLVYRLVYKLTTGEDLGKRMWRHHCDRSWCVNPSHGCPGDHEQNMSDMKERERHGMSHHMVRHIKKAISIGLSDSAIASATGVGRATVYDIRKGNTFSHVSLEEDQS